MTFGMQEPSAEAGLAYGFWKRPAGASAVRPNERKGGLAPIGSQPERPRLGGQRIGSAAVAAEGKYPRELVGGYGHHAEAGLPNERELSGAWILPQHLQRHRFR